MYYVQKCSTCEKDYDIEFGGCDCDSGFPTFNIEKPKTEITDRLSELEKVIKQYYIRYDKETDKENWFKIEIQTKYKIKQLRVFDLTNKIYSKLADKMIFEASTTKEMFDKAFEFFKI